MTAVGWALLGAAVVLLPGDRPTLRRLHALGATGRLAGQSASVDAAPGRVVPTGRLLVAAGATLVVVVAVVAGPVLAAAAAIVAATVAGLLLSARARRAATRSDTALLSALRLIAAELEAGSRPGAAFVAAADADPARRLHYLAAAQAAYDGRDPPLVAAELRPLRQAWQLAGRIGAPPATVVRRVADDQAAAIAQRDAVSAAVAGARSSAALLAGLPVLGVLLGAAMQARPLAVLFGTPAGRLVCLVGVALDAVGLLWTQRLAARAERP